MRSPPTGSGRALGLDVGERRIGLASGDSDSGMAVPVGVLERTGVDADVQAVRHEAVSRDADTLVVGLPLSMNGRRGPQAESVEAFVTALRAHTLLRVVTVDERLTSIEAARRLADARGPHGRRRRPRVVRGAVDAAAATVILQSYLDSLRD